MIQANKSASFSYWFRLYLQHYLFPRHFQSVRMMGNIDPIDGGPAIYMANHSSWWDGLVIFLLFERLSESNHYVMMLENQLKHYAFFRKLGAFSIEKDKPREILQSFQYASDLLTKGDSVWIFPQGKTLHQETRPIQFEQGIGFLLREMPHLPVKPVSLNYTFGEAQKPIVSVAFGDELVEDWSRMSRKEITHYLENILELQLDEHRSAVIRDPQFQNSHFRPITRIGRSTSDRFDAWKLGEKTR